MTFQTKVSEPVVLFICICLPEDDFWFYWSAPAVKKSFFKYSIEVSGKNKGHEQITGIKNAYLALDNLEYGFMNKVPLWLFGMLY